MNGIRTVGAFLLLLLLLFSIAAAAVSLTPRARVTLFLIFNGDRLERALTLGEGIPIIPGVNDMNFWNGGMAEFVLFKHRNIYCGCYYSKRPRAFQGIDAEFTQIDENSWRWQADGHSGETSLIGNNWYFFRAVC